MLISASQGALLHPVTAATLRASEQQAHTTIRNYRWIAIVLALAIVPWSILCFILTGINRVRRALSPLAIAFVAGCAVDVVFSLIDGAVKGAPAQRDG